MGDWRDSVVLLTNDDPDDSGFGTGFVFHRDGSGRAFVLTCLHLVTALGGGGRAAAAPLHQIRVNDRIAEVWARGNPVLDLAVLAVDGLAAEPLPLGARAQAGQTVEAFGYQWQVEGDGLTTTRRLAGLVLRERNRVAHRWRPEQAWFWDLELAPDLTGALRPGPGAGSCGGYSGAPLWDAASRTVVGIMHLPHAQGPVRALCAECCAALTAGIPDYPAVRPAPAPAAPRPLAAPGPTDPAPGFDCFLSHNSKNKQAVRRLAAELRRAGVRLWLDEEQLRPGLPALPLMESGIRAARSVAILIGADGLGPWEDEEMQAALRLAVRDGRPVIPVLLPDAQTDAQGDAQGEGQTQAGLPLWLANRTWVDLRPSTEPDPRRGLERLLWGITGDPPSPAAPGSSAAALGAREWLACTLDHGEQIKQVERCLLDRDGRPAPGLWFYRFEALPADCPQTLAAHLAVHLGGLPPGMPSLDALISAPDLDGFGPDGLWEALVQQLTEPDLQSGPVRRPAPADPPMQTGARPGCTRERARAHQVQEADARSRLAREQALVRDWINAGRLRALYAEVPAALGPQATADFITGAIERFSAVPGLNGGARVLFLFACLQPAFDWRRGLRRSLCRLWPLPPLEIAACEPLGALSPLTREDRNAWLAALPAAPAGLDPATHLRLRWRLASAFPERAHQVRYQPVYDAVLPLLRGPDRRDPPPGDPQ